MTDIPEDILAVAVDALREAVTVSRSKSADAGFDIIARAILAERDRCAQIAESDDHFPIEGAWIARRIRNPTTRRAAQ